MRYHTMTNYKDTHLYVIGGYKWVGSGTGDCQNKVYR